MRPILKASKLRQPARPHEAPLNAYRLSNLKKLEPSGNLSGVSRLEDHVRRGGGAASLPGHGLEAACFLVLRSDQRPRVGASA